ncbi:MAG: discoidin domain-containing protein [Deltaproteobacteria bacterium]|nr:discoidin domain-containing protein [Deltaproteobacteria bacterium]
MTDALLDDFRDVSAWSAVASGEAQLAITSGAGPDGGAAMRLDYDFRGGGGFVVARRSLPLALPSAWALALRVRGAAPANKLEIKLADPSNRNVWWWHRDAFELPAEWTPLRIRSSEVAFAWGPAGGGVLRELGALEIAIAAGPGGRGSLWIADLRFEDRSLAGPPRATASSAAPGRDPECALAAGGSGWRSAPGAGGTQWLALDFGREHEYGGLVVDWAEEGAPRAFEVQASGDGASWATLWSARQAEGERSYVYLPGGSSRHLRLHLLEPAAGAGGFAIRSLEVQPFEFSRSLAEFFHAVAAREPRGRHPRWLHREQSYWTPAGVAGGTTAAILNEEGLLEPDRGSFTLEPFLFAGGTLGTWADAAIDLTLARGWLPIPSVTWRWRGWSLETTAFAVAEASGAAARVRYRLVNEAADTPRVRLFVALRPFQVSPPWQSFQGIGGTAPIRTLAWRDGAVEVDGIARVWPLGTPTGFGAAAFEQGGVLRALARGELPARAEVADPFAHASGALLFELELAPGAAGEIELAVPFVEREPLGPVALGSEPAGTLREVTEAWGEALGRVRIALAADAGCVDALRTAAGHVLAVRDGPALQPGPRRYTRSWIRDGATMSAALLRIGCAGPVRDFLAWYAPHQAADGNVPCAVDRSGPDWLPEHDSHGQLVFTLVEYARFTGDLAFARRLWPAAQRAVAYLEGLRAQRCTPEYRAPEQRARFGILPESASHEGYLAQPVHSYWDDFWALRGIGDAADLARALGEEAEALRLAALRDALHASLYASIEATIEERGLAYVPGSVEWADFDPAATATALTTTDAAERLPPGVLAATYDEYLAGLRRRRRGEIEWNNYSAYEIRILGALVRLGRRADAHELLAFFLGDRRPRAWNQWPEISWRDPRSPGHLGDVPHAWIGAEYVLALLAMFAYERPADGALVVAAGVSDAWLDAGEVAVAGLPTWWGSLSYTLRRSGPGALRLELGPGLRPPPGGIVVRPPLARPLARVTVDGAPVPDVGGDTLTLRRTPAIVSMES